MWSLETSALGAFWVCGVQSLWCVGLRRRKRALPCVSLWPGPWPSALSAWDIMPLSSALRIIRYDYVGYLIGSLLRSCGTILT